MISNKIKQLPNFSRAQLNRLNYYYHGRFSGNLLKKEGYYEVSPVVDCVNPFYIKLNWYDALNREKRLNGTFELGVMEELQKRVGPNDTYWEVGGWRAYFSMALAPIAGNVVVFDDNKKNCKIIEEQVEENDYSNVKVVHTMIDSEKNLSYYAKKLSLPDIVTIDIKGQELEVLRESDALFENGTVFIIEIHQDIEDNKLLLELLEEHNYRFDEIHRRPNNYHILAEPIERHC